MTDSAFLDRLYDEQATMDGMDGYSLPALTNMTYFTYFSQDEYQLSPFQNKTWEDMRFYVCNAVTRVITRRDMVYLAIFMDVFGGSQNPSFQVDDFVDLDDDLHAALRAAAYVCAKAVCSEDGPLWSELKAAVTERGLVYPHYRYEKMELLTRCVSVWMATIYHKKYGQ